jgi:hypothetical protein
MEKRMATEIPNGWNPLAHQRNLWAYLQGGRLPTGEVTTGPRRAVAVWHRRAGKDSTCLNFEVTDMLKVPGAYWHMLPTQKQAKKVVWNAIDNQGRAIIDQVFPQEIRLPGPDGQNSTDLVIRTISNPASGFKDFSLWQLCGSDSYDSLVGSNLRGVVFSEWSLTDPRAWAYIRPILAFNGGWAAFIYTPRGRNHGWAMLDMARHEPGWFHEVLTVNDTNLLPADVLESERRQILREYGDENLFNQEYLCSFDAATPGAYYSRDIAELERQKRVGPLPWVANSPVDTFWDLGISDSTSITFGQRHGPWFIILHYEEHSGQGLPFYSELLRKLAHERGWSYGRHYWPHDGDHRNLATGEPLSVTARKLGIAPLTVVKRMDPVEGIQFCRGLLKRCWINIPPEDDKAGFGITGTRRFIDALRQYRTEWDEKNRVYKDNPLHDWTSHCADSFRTAATAMHTGAYPVDLTREAKELQSPQDPAFWRRPPEQGEWQP